MDRLPAILIFAGWDRTSARRRKVPLTTVASHRARQRVHGGRPCGGGVPACRDDVRPPAGRSRRWRWRHAGIAVAVAVVGRSSRPQEPGGLSGDRGGHDALDVLARGQRTEPGAPARLGCPRPGGDLWRAALLAAGDRNADRGAVLQGPGRPRPAARAGGRCQPWSAAHDAPSRRWSSSLGTSPQTPMNWPACTNRRQSATSAANVNAPSRVLPR